MVGRTFSNRNMLPRGARTLFSVVFPEVFTQGVIELRFIKSGCGARREFFRSVLEVGAAAGTLHQENAVGWNVYFGVGLRRTAGGGKKSDVLSIGSCFIDYDLRGESVKPLPEVSAELLHRLPVSPALTLDSGHGIHAYFPFTEPLHVHGTEDITRFETVQKRLAHLAQSDAAVSDISRAMRLAGFNNVKDPNAPMPCRILTCHPERRHPFEELELLTAHAPPPRLCPSFNSGADKHISPAAVIPQRFFELLARSPSLRAIWEGRRHYASRSEYDMALACSLAKKGGFSTAEICAVLLSYRYGKFADASPSYLARTIAKAEAFVRAGS